jgi:hypothetical protein
MSDEANTWLATLNRMHTVRKADVLHARPGRQREETGLGATQIRGRTCCLIIFAKNRAHTSHWPARKILRNISSGN